MEPQAVTDQPQPTIPSTPPVSPVVPPSKPKSRIMLLVGGIVILIAGFTIGLFFNKNLSPASQISPTPTPLFSPTPQAKPDPALRDTANWKTYTSGMNFAFLYPPTWFVSETGSTQFPDLRIQNYDPATTLGRGYDSMQDKGKYLLSVNRFPTGNEGVYDLDQLIAKLPKEGDQAYYLGDPAGQIHILKNERGIVNGFSKLTREVSYSKFTDVIENDIYLLNKKGDAIIIHFGLDAINGKKTLDQILSTFKFINSINTISPTIKPASVPLFPTTDWKTATAITFSIKYPPGFTSFVPATHDSASFFRGDKTEGLATMNINRLGDPTGYPPELVYKGGSRRDWYIKANYDSDHPQPNSLKFVDKLFGEIPGLEVYTSNHLDTILLAHGNNLYQLSGDIDTTTLETMASSLLFK